MVAEPGHCGPQDQLRGGAVVEAAPGGGSGLPVPAHPPFLELWVPAGDSRQATVGVMRGRGLLGSVSAGRV